jgi:hypothetical protein
MRSTIVNMRYALCAILAGQRPTRHATVALVTVRSLLLRCHAVMITHHHHGAAAVRLLPVFSLCSVCALVCASPVSGEVGVLEWLSSLPFPAATGLPAADSYSWVSVGPKLAPTEPKTIDPTNPPLDAAPGSVLSDSFHTTPLRRGLLAQREFKNGTEILKVAFEQMFNYSSPMAPGVSVAHTVIAHAYEWRV